jgi:cellulose biosynthesis protein BcsQ
VPDKTTPADRQQSPRPSRLFPSDDGRIDPFGRSGSLFGPTEEETAAPAVQAPPPDDTVERGALVEKLHASLRGPARTAPPQFTDNKELLDARRTAAQQSQLRGTLKGHRAVALVSEIGGSGKTTASFLLANTLALARQPSSIMLFEADPMTSILASRLARPMATSMQPVLEASRLMTERVDWSPHTEQLSSGLQILFGPDHPSLDQALRGPDYLEILDKLFKHYEIVVIDTPTGFGSPASLTALQAADQLIFCARAAAPDLRQAEASLEWVRSQGGQVMAETAILAITETSPGAYLRLPKADQAPNPAFFATCWIPYDERLADSKLTSKRLHDATNSAYQYLAMATAFAFPVVEEEDLSANPGWKEAQSDSLDWIQ